MYRLLNRGRVVLGHPHIATGAMKRLAENGKSFRRFPARHPSMNMIIQEFFGIDPRYGSKYWTDSGNALGGLRLAYHISCSKSTFRRE